MRKRSPAETINPADVVSFTPYRDAQDRSVAGVATIALHDGRTMYGCRACALMWTSPARVRHHKFLDAPHRPGGTTPPMLQSTELDVYASSSEPQRSEVVPREPAAAQRAPRTRPPVDSEAFLDANGEAVKVSMVDFLDALLASRTAARAEAAEQSGRAERAIRSEAKMRDILVQMRTMIDRVLGQDEA